MSNYLDRVNYTEVPLPEVTSVTEPIDLTDATMAEHKSKILSRMSDSDLDAVVIYGDREHGTNFGYLAGFEPRFEEIALVLHKDGKAYMMLGNESLRMSQYSRIEVTPVHVPYFSLPNQPMGNEKNMTELMIEAGISEGMKVGVVGWKMFTSAIDDNEQLYDVPWFIVKAINEAVTDQGTTVNAAPLFIHPGVGARATVNANEIAHYEFGAALASEGMLRMLNKIEVGALETELAAEMASLGQPHNVQTICATGDRFTNAVVAPRAKAMSVGDKFSSTVGFRGGLSSRSGYVVESAEQLPEGVKDYLDRVAMPYYSAAVAWYENIHIGMMGGEMYDLISEVIPKKDYGWHLNPGHLTAGEEWMSSPMNSGSKDEVVSGMMFQMDIIPSVPGYGGAGAEDGVAIADEALRSELAKAYPEVWARIQKRRDYMINTLGIKLRPEVLPLSNTAGYMRPLLLNKTHAFKA